MTTEIIRTKPGSPEFKHICRYCNETPVTLRLEEVTKWDGTNTYKWIPRDNHNQIHACITGKY